MRNFIISAGLMLAASVMMDAQTLTILHTNDTHSQVDPTAGPEDMGGAARRKVLIDSIRSAVPSAMLVDAGDAVQGSMFFTLFGGEVEQKLLNGLGYDIQILGNHEFDNGMEALARNYRNATPVLLASNYDLRQTPLAGLFRPYLIKEVEGRKVAFMALNINPAGLIDEANWSGLRYLDTIEAANALAWYLKNIENVDMVVAISHIGLDEKSGANDRDVATRSRNIDVIIGGHSHTLIRPGSQQSMAVNLDGDTVLIAQTGKKGLYLGEITLDIAARKASAKLHPVTSRLDALTDGTVERIVAPYRYMVDSVSAIKIGRAAVDFPQESPRLLNWLSDYVMERGAELAGTPVDLAIMNKGGIRNSLAKGVITKGDIMTMLPFDNRIVVLDIKGSDLLDNLKVMAGQGGNGLSRGMDVSYDSSGVVSATLGGTPLDPQATYRLATISYLANGGDYMAPLKKGKIVVTSPDIIFNDIINSFEHGSRHGKTMKPDDKERMHLTR